MQEVLALAPGGSPLAQSLGFPAATVIVDNLTNSYLTLTDVGKTIPPWTYGAVVALPPGLRRASAKLTATVPAIPGPPVPLSQATLTWTDAPLPASPGHLLQQLTTSQQGVLGTLSAAAGQQTSQDFTIPAGTLSIGFQVRADGSPANDTPQAVSITGDQTKVQYFLLSNSTVTETDGPQARTLDTTDTSMTVAMTANAAKPSAIDVLVWPVVGVKTEQNRGGVPLGVVLQRTDGSLLTLDTPGGSILLGVSLADAKAAPWQAPNLRPIPINNAITAGAANRILLLAGAVGKTIYVFSAGVALDVAAAVGRVALADGDPNAGGTPFDGFTQATISPQMHVYGGAPLTSGNGLYIESDANVAVRGYVSVSQA